MTKEQYNHANITYQSQSLQFAITESGTSYQYNKEISEPIKAIEERPIFVLISLMKQYITSLF